MEKSEKSIIKWPLLLSFLIGTAFGGAACTAFHFYRMNMPVDQPVMGMRHTLPEANSFIQNYLRNPARQTPIRETGWLVNSSELKAFVNEAYYVHISLARENAATDSITLVISGATRAYHHRFPTTEINGTVQPYALESVHPCPQCFNEANDTRPAFKVANDLGPDSDAVRR